MFFGVLVCAVSTVMQSAAYVFSRRFLARYRSPVKLLIYAQLWMGIFGTLSFVLTSPFSDLRFSRGAFAEMAAFAACYALAHASFFRTLKEVEASRASSLLGLKVIVVALIAALIGHVALNVGHGVAIVLTAVAGVGMNFSGVRLSGRGALFLTLSLLGFSVTDIVGAHLGKLMSGNSIMLGTVGVISLSYALLGVFALAAFTRMKFERQQFAAAFPYALLWFVAMLLLFASFGIIGVVLGTIIQAGRGVISVVLGVLIAKRGHAELEPDVSPRLWIRRAAMALLMLGAIALYMKS